MTQSLQDFITLPEALQRIATYISDAHLESAKIDFQAVSRQSPQSNPMKCKP